uniref:HMG box domain-containing protein n=1 Tax=Panagrellus redivivus TaxID=6233 RepID=A0A7E4ZZU1_PANRE
MADCTLPLNRFCAENILLMRQLKPFRFYDDASQKRLLESAWTKLGGKNKHYFVMAAEEQVETGKLTALTNLKEVGENDAFEIYRTEMRLILLQDPVFVKDHFHELQDVIKDGWKGLNVYRKLCFSKRAVLATQDGYTEKTAEQQRRSVKYFNPNDAFLTNQIDKQAFNEYATLVHAKDPSLNDNALWTKWMHELTHQEREYYYQKVIQQYVSTNAKLAFIREKTTKNHKNMPQYSDEGRLLNQAWNDLSDLAQLVYISKSYEKIHEADQNPLTRFKKEHYCDDDYFRKTAFDDMQSFLQPIHPYYDFRGYIAERINHDRFALRVYVEKVRPELLKKPGMVQKRYWEVSFILRDQWNALSKEEQQPYYDMVSRYLEISKQLSEWKLNEWEVAGMTSISYKVDAETAKKHRDIALRNRKILQKKYPDLLEYFEWIKICHSDTTSAAHPSESSSDTKKADAGTEDLENDTKKSDELTNTDFYYMMTMDSTDTAAFWQYRHTVETMTTEYVMPNVWWKQFMNLTDEERNVYYDAAFKKKVLKKARTLFAIDYCPVIGQSTEVEEYAKKMPYLCQTWEGLSDPAKQYYIDLAEPEVLKHENEIKENGKVKREGESCYDVDKKSSEFDGFGFLTNKKGYGAFSKSDYKNAFNIYLQKQHQKVWKEPGMSDKRYFQVALILEQRFKDLSDEKRKPYFDIVSRLKEIAVYRMGLLVDWCSIYSKKNNYSLKYENASEEERAACREEAKQNFVTLMEKFPDLGEYCYWMVYHNSETVKSPTSQPSKIYKAGDPTLEIIYDTDDQKGTETTSVIDAESIVNDNTSEESESVDTWELVEGENVAVENNTVTEKNVEKELQTSPLNATTVEESESAATWEVVDDETDNEEGKPSKPTE